jgi:hypothetical protein
MTASPAAPRARRRTTKQETPTDAPLAISREEYAEFIGQIELSNIWLHEAHINNMQGPQTPDQATFRFRSTARWEPQDGGFHIFHHYTVHVETVDAPLAELDIALGVDFASKLPLTDEIFAIFEDVNLPVNTWPFLREFVSTAVGRMGWIPFTIPALKQGVKRTPRPPTATRTRRPRTQRASE